MDHSRDNEANFNQTASEANRQQWWDHENEVYEPMAAHFCEVFRPAMEKFWWNEEVRKVPPKILIPAVLRGFVRLMTPMLMEILSPKANVYTVYTNIGTVSRDEFRMRGMEIQQGYEERARQMQMQAQERQDYEQGLSALRKRMGVGPDGTV
jgi:hypothetical protein